MQANESMNDLLLLSGGSSTNEETVNPSSIQFDGKARSTQGIEARRVATAARQRAYKALARSHPNEFQTIFDAEKQAAGWQPSHIGRPRKDDQ